MIPFELPTYHGTGVHAKTTWKISTITDFTILTSLLLVVEESIEYKDVLYADISIPVGVTYYLQATRHAMDGTVLLIESILPIRKSSDTILPLINGLGVELPTVKIKTNSITTMNPFIEFETSAIRPNGSSHKSSTWVFTSLSGSVLFTSIEDEVNLKTITLIEDNIDFSKYGKIKVRVSHMNNEGVSSSFAEFIFKTNVYTVAFISNFRNIDPDTGLTLTIDPSSTIQEESLSKVNIIDAAKKKIIYTIDNFVNNDIVPARVFDYDSNYTIEFSYKRPDNRISLIYKHITTISKNEVFRSDVDFTYKDLLTLSTPEITEDLDSISPDNRFLDVLSEDVLIGITTNSKLYFIYFQSEISKISNTGFILPFEVNGVTTPYRVMVLNSEMFLLDIVSTIGERHLVVFNHNSSFLTLKIIHDVVVESTTGLSPISYDYGTGKVYFLTNFEDIKKVKTLSIESGLVEDISTPESYLTSKEILCVYAPNKVMVLGDNSLLSYNTVNRLWDIVKTLPIEMQGKDYFTVRRSDNSILFIPNDGSNIYLFDYTTSEIVDTELVLTDLSRIYRTRDNSIFFKTISETRLYKYS